MGTKFLRWRTGILLKEFLNAAGCSFNIPPPDAYPGYPVYLQKPFHVILLTLTSVFFGLKHVLGAVHSACYGMGTIVLTGWLGHRLAGRSAALLSAAWIAFEPYHVFYSRIGLHETDSMLVLLAGSSAVFLWHETRRPRYLLYSGLLLTLALGTSYRLLIPILIMICSITPGRICDFDIKKTLRGWAVFLAGVAISAAFLELSYRLIFSPDYLWSQPPSYLALLKKKFISPESSFDLAYPWFYFGMFIRFDGWFPTLLAMAALIYLPWKRNFQAVVVFLMFVLPFALFSMTSTRLARTPTGLLPWSALAVGMAWTDFRSVTGKLRKPFRCIVTGGIWGAVLLSFGLQWPSILKIQSGYRPVIEYLNSKGQHRCLATMKPIFAFYMGRENVDDPADTVDGLCRQVGETGVRYMCLDWQKFVRYRPGFKAVEMEALPVFAAYNPVTEHFATFHENYLPGDVPVIPHLDPAVNYIKVYDLYDVLPRLGCRPVLPGPAVRGGSGD